MGNVTPYCFLVGDSAQWDGADMAVLTLIFHSVIEEVNTAVGLVPQRQLLIKPAWNLGNPMCSKAGETYIIFLTVRQNLK